MSDLSREQFRGYLFNQRVPLEYNRWPKEHMRRIAAVDPSVEPRQQQRHRTPGMAEQDYWSPELRITGTKTGKPLKKPKVMPNPNVVNPHTVAFADIHEPDRNTVYLDYLNTRSDQTGRGHARRLVDEIARQYPTHSLDFGRVMHPAIWKLKEDLEARGRKTAGYKYF